MQTKAIILALAGIVTVPAVAEAQVGVDVSVRLPTIRFEVAPPLVVVSEGVQVVPDYREEVFYQEGWYWHRTPRAGHWYRTRDYRGGWVLVERRHVPITLVGIPAGKYKHHKHHDHGGWKHKRGKGHGHGHAHAHGHGHGRGKHKRK